MWALSLMFVSGLLQATEVHEFQLDNGLKILVQEDHRAPVVVSQIWYKVGSSYEHGGITGVSHVLEHMMFKGTEKHASGEFSRIIALNGGRENAFTSSDYTAYFQRINKDRLGLCLELEADRMRNLRLDATEFAKEVNVVKEERRMRTDDKPRSLTYERFKAVAYSSSPYGNPVIGWMGDLDSLTLEDAQTWYEAWYAPNNATLVVVGDVKPAEVFALAKHHFGALKPSKQPLIKARAEVQQHGTQRLTLKLPAKLPYLIMGYKTPVLKSVDEPWKAYALEVLVGILDGGDSARFSDRLVRSRQLAASAGASYNLHGRLDAMLVLDGIPAQDHDLDALETALLAEVELLKQGKISVAELNRVKAGVLASSVYERDSMFYQAMQIGILETNGVGYQALDEYLAAIQAVTVKQVAQVAREYLKMEQLTVARLEPLPLETEKKPPASRSGLRGDKL
ncbi:MAG: pitrilysin family protein [Gammaproteobacteria bacterium]|nr:pitrilysin family protein [Gammaproteobacteria bacterium]